MPDEKPATLHEIAQGLHNRTIFSTFHINPRDRDLMMTMVFLPLVISDPINIPEDLAMVWEWFSKAGPRGMNGYPTFMSCNLVGLENTNKIVELLHILEDKAKAKTPEEKGALETKFWQTHPEAS